MPTTFSGFFIQSTFGIKGNYELVVPDDGSMAHLWRDNDAPGFPWEGPSCFGSSDVTDVSLIQSNFGTPGLGELVVAARIGDELALFTRSDQTYMWSGPVFFASGVSGNPALIQGRFGTKGNFELVVPYAAGGIAHYWRNNDDPSLPWYGPITFGQSLGQVDAVAMIQSNYGFPGELNVIARVGNKLAYFWRDPDSPYQWHGGSFFFTGAQGVPGFIQSDFGTVGNFELVTPLEGGGLAHLWRNNDNPNTPWDIPRVFGSGNVSKASLFQSNFGTPGLGNFEVAAQVGNQYFYYWREDQLPYNWSGPELIYTTGGCAASRGNWEITYSSGIVGIHAAQLHTEKVLFFSFQTDPNFNLNQGVSSVLDLDNGNLAMPLMKTDPLSSGHVFIPDGRLIDAGGDHNGVNVLRRFTPCLNGGFWEELGSLSGDRWYPTCTALPDGHVFIISGAKDGGGPIINPTTCQSGGHSVNATYEIYDPQTGSLEPPVQAPFLNEVSPYAVYPFVFVLPSGKLFIHANTKTTFLDLATWIFDETILTTVSPVARTYPSEGTSVLLPLLPDENYRARIMLFGGAGASCPTTASYSTPATNTCEILDLGVPDPAWSPAPAMFNPRVLGDSVLLPDGTVLVVNGSSTGVADFANSPVYQAELYDPVSNTWTTMASATVPRLYHATALLLPDGRVLTAGRDGLNNPPPYNFNELRVEIFSPPYLFRGPGPAITAVPEAVAYDETFVIESPNASSIVSAAFLRPGAVTHSFNMEQRYVGLEIVSQSSTTLTLKAPPDGYVAPPGYYMLFILNFAGVPSVAKFINLG